MFYLGIFMTVPAPYYNCQEDGNGYDRNDQHFIGFQRNGTVLFCFSIDEFHCYFPFAIQISGEKRRFLGEVGQRG